MGRTNRYSCTGTLSGTTSAQVEFNDGQIMAAATHRDPLHDRADPAPALYVWIAPDPAVQAAIDAHRRAWWWPEGSHQPKPHRLHLTLCPLGARSDAQLEGIDEALRGVRAGSFELVLDRSGVWTRNGVAVVCPQAHPGLTKLHHAIERAILPWARPAPWEPHITIARRALGAGAQRMTPIRWQVREFVLVRSWLPPHRVWHEVLGRHRLV
ncbi:2'-5' RNA ligase [Variovorax sp. SRS16]|nr:2'-5' RNA ligase [Variovorax sp. SRS16]